LPTSINTPALNKQLPGGKTSRVLGSFIFLAILLLLTGDISISTATPGAEFQRMLYGLLHPHWLPLTALVSVLFKTISYALLGVAIAAICGFFLSLVFHVRLVRIICASLRAVHELFWGLLLIQFFGLQPLSGILALALPYTGILAKIYAEIRQAAQQHKQSHLPTHSSLLSRFFYGDWPCIKSDLAHYTLYRFECGLRSSTILGFIGLPTLGFHLETAFMQGHYADVSGMLLIFYGLIATVHWWGQFKFWALYLVAALGYLWPDLIFYGSNTSWFFQQMIPAPFRESTINFNDWLNPVLTEQLFPGLWQTLVTGQIALVLSAMLALLLYPLLSRHFGNPATRWTGHLFLVILRSTPELIMGFAFLLLWGPSLLPAIAALAIHNGAILAHLTGRFSDNIQLRPDVSSGVNCYCYELTPRLSDQFLVLIFYRWEVIMRESALLGILGLHTLGFFIDSAFESFRLDVALILIVASAILNIVVDNTGRLLRQYLQLTQHHIISSN
jgi:phosphonate transport system permease protein